MSHSALPIRILTGDEAGLASQLTAALRTIKILTETIALRAANLMVEKML